MHYDLCFCWEFKQSTFSRGPGLFDPVSQVAHEVKEKVSFWDADHFVGDFDE